MNTSEKLESLESELRETQWEFDHWLASEEANTMEDEQYEILYWEQAQKIDDLTAQIIEIINTL